MAFCKDEEGCRMFHVVGAECPCADRLEKDLEQLKEQDPMKWIALTGGDIFNQPYIAPQSVPQPQPYIAPQPTTVDPWIITYPDTGNNGGFTWTSADGTIYCNDDINGINGGSNNATFSCSINYNDNDNELVLT